MEIQVGQSVEFSVMLQGITNPAVQWSLSPDVGTLVNGVYTAPSTVSGDTQVTITATSLVSGGVSGTATVLILQPVTPVTVSLSAAATSVTAGQSVTLTAVVTGSANTGVTWLLTPNIGTINNGVYIAPASVSATENIVVTATSQADPTKSASVSLVLKPAPTLPATPVSVTLSPSTASLDAGQSVTFTTTVSGTSNSSVTWSLNPQVGQISNGVYQAPSTISARQTVTITATSGANPTQTASASAVVTLIPVAITMSPATSTVFGGQTATYTATVSGSSNTAVTWSLNPQVGTITNGVYQAPATIPSQQTVTITATSAADPTKTANATVSLVPVSITVAPNSVSLAPGKSATFTASITGSSNTTVNWSINPATGTIVNGVYTAPATVAAAQQVTITATSVADSTKSATATVSLTASASAPSTTPSTNASSTSTTTVTLPVEVMGPAGTTAAVSVTVPSGSNLSGSLTLWMQIHGLKYDSEASVQVNNSAWLPISTGNVTLLGNAAAFGGIGGGFHTLQLTMNLPAGSVVAGSNTITFQFNGTDGVVSGYRVLAFNIQSAGTNLIPSSQFVEDDPDTWQPPSTAASDIAAGQALYQSAALTTVNGPIQAHCSDCHTQDGRDLKYFNYSNHSIEVRSMFHGLTAQQGAQIASYIRSLDVPNPGRPWNPPYQPGPGLDSQPVEDWSAGAGLDAVLNNDGEMLPYLTPGGSTAGFSATSYLDARETPVVLQLPDWNSWLPVIHPMDAYGTAFTDSPFNTLLATIRGVLQPNSPTAYSAALGDFYNWVLASMNFMSLPAVANTVTSAPTELYSIALWEMVKHWELNQEFGLEGMPQVPFGAKADLRSWYGNNAFYTAPNMMHIADGPGNGVGNGSAVTKAYFDSAWYQLQLVLNDGQGTQSGHNPIDYGYVIGDDWALFAEDAGLPGMMLQLEMQIKALQEFTQSGVGPQTPYGFHPIDTSPMMLVDFNNAQLWSATPPATEAALTQAYTQAWFNQVSTYTPQQFYEGGWATATENPATDFFSTTFGGQVWYMLPRLRYVGVDPTLTYQISAWAAQIWPLGNWALNNSATCTGGQTASTCTSD